MSKIIEYQELNLQDNSLWRAFRANFHNWTVDTFSLCSPGKLEKLREILRHHGIWVSIANTIPVGRSLLSILGEPQLAPWTRPEIVEHLELEGSFNSKLVNSLLHRNGLLPQPPPEQRIQTPYQMLSPKTPAQPPPQGPQRDRTPIPVPPPEITPEPRGYRSKGEQDYEFVDREDYEDSLETEPRNKFGKQLGNLGKMYTDEMKYSGENDNFDYKLVIFNDFCDRADVPEAAKAKAYPTML